MRLRRPAFGFNKILDAFSVNVRSLVDEQSYRILILWPVLLFLDGLQDRFVFGERNLKYLVYLFRSRLVANGRIAEMHPAVNRVPGVDGCHEM